MLEIRLSLQIKAVHSRCFQSQFIMKKVSSLQLQLLFQLKQDPNWTVEWEEIFSDKSAIYSPSRVEGMILCKVG